MAEHHRALTLPHTPFRSTLKRLDAHSWTLAGWLLIAHHFDRPAPEYTWPDGQGAGGYFAIHAYPEGTPLPIGGCLTPLSTGTSVLMLEPQLFNQVEDHHTGARWRIGEAYLNVCEAPSGPTATEVVLRRMNGMSLSFQVPRVIWAASRGGRRYTLTSTISGDCIRLPRLWRLYWGKESKKIIIAQIVKAYLELALVKGDQICDLSGKPVSTYGLESETSEEGAEFVLDPAVQLQNARDAGLDCSELVLAHVCRPNSFIFDKRGVLLGIDDWSDAAFVPKDWVLTRMLIDSWRWTDEGWPIKWAENFRDLIQERMLLVGFRNCKESW